MRAAVGRLRAAGRFGWRVLGYGTQPAGQPTHDRADVAQAALSQPVSCDGDPWLWYTVTASDQLQFSIRRDEMLHMLNYGNMMARVISPVRQLADLRGKDSHFCSAR